MEAWTIEKIEIDIVKLFSNQSFKKVNRISIFTDSSTHHIDKIIYIYLNNTEITIENQDIQLNGTQYIFTNQNNIYTTLILSIPTNIKFYMNNTKIAECAITPSQTLQSNANSILNDVVITSELDNLSASPPQYNAKFNFEAPTPVQSDNNYILSSTNPISMCLLKGTLILTPSGQQLIETLKANDEIITSDGVTHKIKYMHHEHSVSETMLYVIRKNAVSENVPFEDLYLSGGHAVLIDGKLYHPEHHRNNKLFEKIKGTSICEFYHIALDVYFDTYLVANGLPAELVGYEFKDEHTWNCVHDEHCSMVIKKLN